MWRAVRFCGAGIWGMFVEQRVVMAGKLGLQRRAAEQSRQAAGHLQEAERLRVLITIRGLYYRALGEQRLVKLRQDMGRGLRHGRRRRDANWRIWGRRIDRMCWLRISKRSGRSWASRWRGMRSRKPGRRSRRSWGSRIWRRRRWTGILRRRRRWMQMRRWLRSTRGIRNCWRRRRIGRERICNCGGRGLRMFRTLWCGEAFVTTGN